MYELVDRPVERLSEGSRFLLWAMRAWTDSLGRRQCPPGALAGVFLRAGVIEALPDFHRLLTTFSREAKIVLGLAPMHCGRISEDEAILLSLWSDAEREPLRAQATLELLIQTDAVPNAFQALLTTAQQLRGAGLPPLGLAATAAEG
ncbi:MAG: hypothetical protein JOY99_04665 [Sphingomonadaceae bacterium]|nr:hypothetical protein [Sphingomonadaceae bacterium]